MPKLFNALALSLLLAASTAVSLSPALAQTDTATPAPTADAAVPNDLSMGATERPGLPNQADAAMGDTYLAAEFDQWQQRCVKTVNGSDPCQLYQLLYDVDGNSVGEISLFNLPDGAKAAAGATFMAPLETLLTANVKISVDKKQAKFYPFAFCAKVGCVARIGLTTDELAAMKKGVSAVITIVPAAAPDKTVDLTLTLKGFTAGFEAVKTANLASNK
ncbi:MAG: invasion associated locus B family protein [bacterium]